MQTSWEFSDCFYGCTPLSSRHRHMHLSSSCQLSFLAANKLSLRQLNFQEACQGIAFISIKRNEIGKKRKRLDSPQNAPHAPLLLLGGIGGHSAFQGLWMGLLGGVDPPWLQRCTVFLSVFPSHPSVVSKSHVLQCQAVPLCELG